MMSKITQPDGNACYNIPFSMTVATAHPHTHTSVGHRYARHARQEGGGLHRAKSVTKVQPIWIRNFIRSEMLKTWFSQHSGNLYFDFKKNPKLFHSLFAENNSLRNDTLTLKKIEVNCSPRIMNDTISFFQSQLICFQSIGKIIFSISDRIRSRKQLGDFSFGFHR